MLAHLDVGPQLGLGGLAGLLSHGADGANHPAAGTVDLGDAELDLLALHGGQVRAAGLAALGGGHEHPHALDGHHDAALVLLGDGALQDGLVLHGLLDVLPDLGGVQTLLAELRVTLHVVDPDHPGLDLVAHMDQVLGLDIGIVAQFAELDVSGLLGPHVHLDLVGGDGRHDAGHPVTVI